MPAVQRPPNRRKGPKESLQWAQEKDLGIPLDALICKDAGRMQIKFLGRLVRPIFSTSGLHVLAGADACSDSQCARSTTSMISHLSLVLEVKKLGSHTGRLCLRAVPQASM